jgi:hypothetical protein
MRFRAREGRILQSGFAGIKFAATILIAGALGSVPPLDAAAAWLPLTGNLIGSVVDSAGAPQMGATVQLLNRYELVLAKAITASDGRFVFAGLPLDTYAVRVSQPSFLPAFRDRITIKPGSDSVLQIHLATLFSNIQVSYKLPSGAMTNDWKWVLRTSAATRPVTRFLPELKPQQGEANPHPQIFSDTHALLSLNGGDSGMIDTGMAAGDLGSIFALSTNLFGKNQVQIAGSLGQSGDFAPAVRGLAAVYQRDSQNTFANAPEVTLTVSQFNRFGAQITGPEQMPSLRVMALSLYQVADPLDNLHLEYGVTGESVNYLQYTARLSPFARATLTLTPKSELIAAYSDGGRPDELTAHAPNQTDAAFSPAGDLVNAVNALERFPQISNSNGRLVLQRSQNYELGYTRHAGARTYAFSGFHEQVWDGQLNLSGNMDQLNPGNLLFDGVSKTSTYNVGSFSRSGYVGTVTQRLSDHMDLGIAYGRMGGFLPDPSHSFGDGSAFLRMGLHDVAGANFRASIPASGTRITAGYGWIDAGSVVPLHVFTTQSDVVSPGLNFGLRQPLPSLFGFPGHLMLTADLRNLLAQGYIPVGGAGQLLVVQSPRAIRGGLNLTF